jgi:hypothetical protein
MGSSGKHPDQYSLALLGFPYGQPCLHCQMLQQARVWRAGQPAYLYLCSLRPPQKHPCSSSTRDVIDLQPLLCLHVAGTTVLVAALTLNDDHIQTFTTGVSCCSKNPEQCHLSRQVPCELGNEVASLIHTPHKMACLATCTAYPAQLLHASAASLKQLLLCCMQDRTYQDALACGPVSQLGKQMRAWQQLQYNSSNSLSNMLVSPLPSSAGGVSPTKRNGICFHFCCLSCSV